MFGLGYLKAAITRLANALSGLAETVETANANARERLLLDDPTPPVNRIALSPAEEPEEAAANGRKKK